MLLELSRVLDRHIAAGAIVVPAWGPVDGIVLSSSGQHLSSPSKDPASAHTHAHGGLVNPSPSHLIHNSLLEFHPLIDVPQVCTIHSSHAPVHLLLVVLAAEVDI